MALNGRIMGVSGIAAGILGRDGEARRRGLLFVGGMLLGGLVLRVMLPQSMPGAITGNLAWLAVAGFIVGFGTRLGGGCTSGHGVCGISRLSARSITATGIFMLVAVVTVYVVRHVLGLTL